MSSPIMMAHPGMAGQLHHSPHHQATGRSPAHSPMPVYHAVHHPWQSPMNHTSYNYAERSILQSPFLPPSNKLQSSNQVIVPPLMGLANHGNSCFLNALLQVLAHSPLLIQTIMEVVEKSSCCMPPPSSSSVAPHSRQLSRPVSTSVLRNEHSPATQSPARSPLRTATSFSSPSTQNAAGITSTRVYAIPCERCLHCILLRTLLSMNHSRVTSDVLANSNLAIIKRYAEMPIYTFAPGKQEDAHELFANIMQLFRQGHRQLPTTAPSSSSTQPVVDKSIYELFSGKTKSLVYCFDCQNITSMEEHIVDLSLEISRASDLRSALSDYFNTELLHGENAYDCAKCGQKRKAQKCIRLEESPKVLAIQLKRFRYEDHQMQKVNHHVSVSEELDLQDFYNHSRVANGSERQENLYSVVDLRYDLKGIVVHVGDSPHTGHYIAYVKKRLYSSAARGSCAEKWFKIDDRYVKEVSASEALQSQAYILLYDSKVWHAASSSKAFHSHHHDIVQQALSEMLFPSKIWRASEAIWPQVNFTLQYDEYHRAEEDLRQQRRLSHSPAQSYPMAPAAQHPQGQHSPPQHNFAAQLPPAQYSAASSARRTSNGPSIKRTKSQDSTSSASQQRHSRQRTDSMDDSTPRSSHAVTKAEDLTKYDVKPAKASKAKAILNQDGTDSSLKTVVKFFRKLVGSNKHKKQADIGSHPAGSPSQSSTSSRDRKRKHEDVDTVDITEVYVNHQDKVSTSMDNQGASSSNKEEQEGSNDNGISSDGARKKARKEPKGLLDSLLKVFAAFRQSASSERGEDKIRKGPYKWT